jgi:putative aminopeptidase FrvX
MDIYPVLQRLTQAHGPSGREQPVTGVIAEIWETYVDALSRDRVGSLVGVKRGDQRGDGRRLRLLLAAHSDEIALMVKQLVAFPQPDGNGFLRVSPVGGVDVRHLYGQLVIVHGARDLHGIIGALPATMLPEARRSRTYNYDELVVDVGLPLAELQSIVAVGDYISFRQPLRKLLNDRVSGKALDNRASVAAVTACLEYLQGRRHDWDVIAVATAQEETRLLGAYTSAHGLQPDAAIAVDVTFGKGPGAKDVGQVFELDGGPVLGLGPNVHPGIFSRLQEAAEALEMTIHTEIHTRASGTDAYGLQIAREGIPTGLVSIPLRYMHTMVETAALADIERTGRLLGEFVARLDASVLDEIAGEMM